MSPEKFIAIVRDALRDPDLLPSLPQILSSELACDILGDLKPVIRQEGIAAAVAAAEPLKPKQIFSGPLDEAAIAAVMAEMGRNREITKVIKASVADVSAMRARLKTAMEQANLCSEAARGISEPCGPTCPPRWSWLPNRAGLLDALIFSREIIDNLSVEVGNGKASGSTIAKIDDLITKAKGGAA